MFKLVSDTLPPELTGLSPAVVDVQLVGDALAGDRLFTQEKSKPKAGTPNTYTYVSLRDAVPAEELEEIRRFVSRALSSLAGTARLLCFFTGPGVEDSDVRGMENSVVIQAHHDELGMSGKVVITDLSVDDVDEIAGYWGNYDCVRGVAVMPSSVGPLLSELRLFEPVPTTSSALLFQRPKFEAIRLALKHGAFFFEELDNGTRLRIVSSAMPQADLSRAMAALVEGDAQAGS